MKKIIIPISTLFVVGISHAQTTSNLSTSENYVYSKTYLHYPKPGDADQTIKSSETVQYLDGLGRPKQIVNIKASPLSKDVVTPIVYDSFGRQTRNYLPVPQNSTSGGQIYSQNNSLVPYPVSDVTNVYNGEKTFTENLLENSPLDRVLEQRQVGDAWNSKPVKFEYDANANGEVKKYSATFNYSNFHSEITLSTAGYGPNQLYKNIVIDEDLNKTIEFKNGQGQTVLVRKMLDDTTSADTYYVYNDYNQLAYVIPPLAVAANAVDPVTLSNLCYQYKYDARNRLVEKKLPGKGWEYMLYDKQDRVVATRDSVLEGKGQWLYTKYDQFGRVVLTGISTGGSRVSEQSNVDTFGSNNTPRISTVSFTSEGMDVYYRGFLTYPDNSKYVKLLSVNYYDAYPSYGFNPAIPTSIYNVPVLTDNSTGSNISTKSLPVMSFVKNIEDDNWTKNGHLSCKKAG
jgi:YD repeat-containing protein